MGGKVGKKRKVEKEQKRRNEVGGRLRTPIEQEYIKGLTKQPLLPEITMKK